MRHRSVIALCKFLYRIPNPISQKLCIYSSSPILQRFHSLAKPQTYSHPDASSAASLENRRRYGSDAGGESPADVNKEVDEINLKFAEAREEIEMAMESKETVYFDEEAECARAAVAEVLEMFESLLRRLPEAERGAIQRSMGLKIEQLKAELHQLNE